VWLQSTALSAFITQNSWVWPTLETLHFLGLAFLVGIVGLFDFRMLGFMRTIRPAALHQLIPWGILGFVVNFITGILFFVGTPYVYMHNAAFYLKILFILLAGVNVVVFYATMHRKIEAMGPGDDAPGGAKFIAAASLLLWMAVIVSGRIIAFVTE